MSRTAIPIKEKVAAHRERLKAAGRIYVNTDLPADLVARLDQIVSSRAPIIGEALRFYIENAPRT